MAHTVFPVIDDVVAVKNAHAVAPPTHTSQKFGRVTPQHSGGSPPSSSQFDSHAM